MDRLYEEFTLEFMSHLLEQLSPHEFVPHLQAAISRFLEGYGHIRSGHRRGAEDFDALTVAEAVLRLAPRINLARPWRAGFVAVQLYGAFLRGLTGLPHERDAARVSYGSAG